MPGAPSTHKTLQGAVDSAANGTIIYVEPSPVSYGVINLNKPVTMIGNGYFLGLNPAPYTQANVSGSVLTTLSMTSGAEGSMITGISFTGQFDSSSVRLSLNGVSNITFSRCYFVWDYMYSNYPSLNCAYLENVSGITFRQNFFECAGQGFVAAVNTISNIVYENNIFYGHNILHLVSPYGAGLANSSLTYTNNTFHSKATNINLGGSHYFNNIFLYDHANAVNVDRGALSATNNVSNKPIFPAAGNNTAAVFGDVLLLSSNPAILSPDGRMQLKQGSVAQGYGQGGTDAGAFGGTHKYVLSGIPFVPNIYYKQIAPTGTTAGGLKLHLKMRANQ